MLISYICSCACSHVVNSCHSDARKSIEIRADVVWKGAPEKEKDEWHFKYAR